MLDLMRELYPICRSITGDGVRETLRIIQRVVPVEVHEVPSGTPVLDWTVPDEWNVRDAWIADASGRRIVDFRASNLHVVGYSEPIRRRVPRDELLEHLHVLEDHPGWIPYRTSYYRRDWGFCVTEAQRAALVDAEYDVCIDATLAPGHLTYGEIVVPGATEGEILLSAHVCHPSLCNDNLSGIAVAVFAARALAREPRRHTIRVVLAPGTIGAITWLARHRDRASRIRHGLTLNCLGDRSPITYKRTVLGGAVDVAAPHVLEHAGVEHQVIDFFPYGYDERQYNSPGFRIPVGSIMRGRHGMFPEYHTSADDFDLISEPHLVESLEVVERIVRVLDADRRCRNTVPEGEPQLGRRGLYDALGGGSQRREREMAMLWVLNLSDGDHGLLDIAARAGLPFERVDEAARALVAAGLLVDAVDQS
jgi:aminopeptidase-like protein